MTFFKELFQTLILMTLLCNCFSATLHAQNYCNSNPVSVHGALSVNGTKIVDHNNQIVSFAGNSFFWSNTGWGGEKFYNANVVNWLKEDWGTTIVRAAMGIEDNGGYINDASNNKNRVKAVVDAAIENDMYVIIDWHSHHAEDYQDQAISFFEEMAEIYGNHPNVIYEIYNEPLQISWSNTIKPYAEAVIAAIRAVDPDNLIVVGTPTWSQDVDVASNDPITGYDNIAYSLHFYAGTHGSDYRQKAQTAIDNGIALMVTEWGAVNASGDGDMADSQTDEWMNFLEANDITHLNWAMNDKLEGASSLVSGASTSGGWSSGSLTECGAKVKGIIENWSQYCSSDDGVGGGGVTGGGGIGEDTDVSDNNDDTDVNTDTDVSDDDNTDTDVSDNTDVNTDTDVSDNTDDTDVNTDTDVSDNTDDNTDTDVSDNTDDNTDTDVSDNNDDNTDTDVDDTVSVSNPDSGSGGNTCDSSIPVNLSFSHDGSGTYCWSISGTISHVNSWEAESVTINGVDYTNRWSNNMPERIDGKYYVEFKGNFAWSHFEANGSSSRLGSASGIGESNPEIAIYPNPSDGNFQVQNQLFKDRVFISIHNAQGKKVYTHKEDIADPSLIDVSVALDAGLYFVTITNGLRSVNKRLIIR